MQIKIDSKSFLIFDLDDTLFREMDFLKSAYSHIAAKLSPEKSLYEQMLKKYENKENVFEWLVLEYQPQIPEINLQWLLKEYRDHIPVIRLDDATQSFLKNLNERKVLMGIITDGRSTTQRNKINALGLTDYFEDILVSEEFGSEKPDERNYLYFQTKYPGKNFYFFGDNTSKDFIVPAKLDWTTICVKNSGTHIHAQSFEKHPIPDFIISAFDEVELI